MSRRLAIIRISYPFIDLVGFPYCFRQMLVVTVDGSTLVMLLSSCGYDGWYCCHLVMVIFSLC